MNLSNLSDKSERSGITVMLAMTSMKIRAGEWHLKFVNEFFNHLWLLSLLSLISIPPSFLWFSFNLLRLGESGALKYPPSILKSHHCKVHGEKLVCCVRGFSPVVVGVFNSRGLPYSALHLFHNWIRTFVCRYFYRRKFYHMFHSNYRIIVFCAMVRVLGPYVKMQVQDLQAATWCKIIKC